MTAVPGDVEAFVRGTRRRGRVIVQPRMGMADPSAMRAGLRATRDLGAPTMGTLTLDSYTRLGEHGAARRALAAGEALNGYPITAHPTATTRAMLDGVPAPSFPVQVRHGSARPVRIVRAMLAAGLDATEGGPVSYCLPYGRTPLRTAVASWARACELLAERSRGTPHLESFGGCLLGQLCPPSLLVAVSVLEALFFRQHGVRSVSVSYAQQTNAAQDRAAVRALRALAAEFLGAEDWHVVIYTYMGVYPRTPSGARRALADSARLAARTGAERLIVKTVAEAYRIPTVEENLAALRLADRAATGAAGTTDTDGAATPEASDDEPGDGVHGEARTLVTAVLAEHPDIGTALLRAFARGLLDVPYCVHPDNPGRARSRLTADGRLSWADTGNLPLARAAPPRREPVSGPDFLSALRYVAHRYDTEELPT